MGTEVLLVRRNVDRNLQGVESRRTIKVTWYAGKRSQKRVWITPVGLKVAAHLKSRGFSACFHDLESGGGFDFLAFSNTIHLEVECKFLSADIGRKLHRRRVYDLAAYCTL